MAKLVDAFQGKLKESSKSMALFSFKLISGLILSLIVALVSREIIGFSNLVFIFIIVTSTGIFLRIAKNWSTLVMVLFDLFAVVLCLLLKMYIVMAPL